MKETPITAEHWFFRPLGDVNRCGLSVPGYIEELLRAQAEAAHPIETGGLLLGWWDQGVPAIAYALEVKDPRATRRRWTRNEAPARVALGKARRQGHKHLGYVGDWHSHPVNFGPSASDLRELRRVSRQYDQPTALAVVRHGGIVDMRLASAGHLTTVVRLALKQH